MRLLWLVPGYPVVRSSAISCSSPMVPIWPMADAILSLSLSLRIYATRPQRPIHVRFWRFCCPEHPENHANAELDSNPEPPVELLDGFHHFHQSDNRIQLRETCTWERTWLRPPSPRH